MKTMQMHVGARLALLAGLAALVICSWFPAIDAMASQQVDAGLKRALISFATARTLNAIVSVAQGTEVSVQPAGVGVVFAPGEILQPMNELIGQFSNLMLAATVAFGIEKILIGMGSHWAISLALTLLAMGWAYASLRQRPISGLLSRLLIIVLMVRFAVPLVTIGSDMLFEKFMAGDYQSSQNVISAASANLGKLNPATEEKAEEQGRLERLKNWFSQSTDVKARFDQFTHAAERAVEHIITLMVIFLMQTLLIPLLLLWLLYAGAKGLFERRSD